MAIQPLGKILHFNSNGSLMTEIVSSTQVGSCYTELIY